MCSSYPSTSTTKGCLSTKVIFLKCDWKMLIRAKDSCFGQPYAQRKMVIVMHICMILTLIFSGFVVLLQSCHTGFGCYTFCSFLSIMLFWESVCMSFTALVHICALYVKVGMQCVLYKGEKQVKLKLSQCTMWKHEEERRGKLHLFLTSVLDEGVWSASCMGHLTTSTHWI